MVIMVLIKAINKIPLKFKSWRKIHVYTNRELNIMTRSADTLIVLDFETSGLSPAMGDRAIEIGAVLIKQGCVTAEFQELMNPGFRVSAFIENYTGISNAMLENAAPCDEVMSRFANFIGDHNLVAHNASFDRRFLDDEFQRIGQVYSGEFACSMLIARRLYHEAPNHTLGELVNYKNIACDGVFHRALADSQMTAQLWLCMLEDLQQVHGVSQPSFAQMQQLSRKSKTMIKRYLQSL